MDEQEYSYVEEPVDRLEDMDEEEEKDFKAYVDDLVKKKVLEHDKKAEGIAKLVADKGFKSLSPAQKYNFRKNVYDWYVVEYCKICLGPIPWQDMDIAVNIRAVCGECKHNSERAEKW